MEDKRIRDLQAQAVPLMSDVIPTDRSGAIEAKKVTIQQISNMVTALGASSYVNVDSLVLPDPSGTNSYSIVGAGTYSQTGEADLVVTGDLNIIFWNGTTWSLSSSIDVDLTNYPTLAETILKDYYQELTNSIFVIQDGLIPDGFTIINNAGSHAYNSTDKVLEITAPANGTGILIQGFPVDDIDFEAKFEVRLKSGDTGKTWNLGWPIEGEGIDFIPTSTWQNITGTFKRQTLTVYSLLIGLNSVGSGVIEIRNISLKKQDAFTLSINQRLSSIEGFSIGGLVFDLEKELAKRDNIFIPVGEHIISSTITIPAGRTITGVRGKSIIKAGASLAQVFQILGNDITLRDFTLKGIAPNITLGGAIPMPVGGKIDSLSDALNKNDIGTKLGIGISASERLNINGVEICNFDGYGIINELSGKNFEYGIKVTDCYFHDNYLALDLINEAEYSSYLGNTFSRNEIGVRVDSGNNLFSNCHFDKNRVGVIVDDGLNNSHGSFSACTFNHNAVFGIITNGITAGEVFEGCQMWYGDIMLLNSKGVNISGSIIAASQVFIDGAKDGGKGQILGCCFASASITPNFNGNTSNVSLKNNYFMDGSSSTSINN